MWFYEVLRTQNNMKTQKKDGGNPIGEVASCGTPTVGLLLWWWGGFPTHLLRNFL
jgi:hypothetical protein